MKIALGPYMFRALPLDEMVRTVAELGYQYIELSPRDDFMPFFLHPRVDDERVADLKNSLRRHSVQLSSVLHPQPAGHPGPHPPTPRHRPGEVDWDAFFGTLRELNFDGVATACVFAWEERDKESSAFMLDRIGKELSRVTRATHRAPAVGRPPGHGGSGGQLNADRERLPRSDRRGRVGRVLHSGDVLDDADDLAGVAELVVVPEVEDRVVTFDLGRAGCRRSRRDASR